MKKVQLTFYKSQMTNSQGRLDFWVNGVDNAGRILSPGLSHTCFSLSGLAHLLNPMTASTLGTVPSYKPAASTPIHSAKQHLKGICHHLM